MHEVVLMAVRKAVSAATRTFTANSMKIAVVTDSPDPMCSQSIFIEDSERRSSCRWPCSTNIR